MIRCSAVQLRQSESRAKRADFTYFDAAARRIAKPQFHRQPAENQAGVLTSEVNGFSRNLDTAGEFVWAIQGAGFQSSRVPKLSRLRLIGRRREFASSITFDDQVPPTGTAVRVFQG